MRLPHVRIRQTRFAIWCLLVYLWTPHGIIRMCPLFLAWIDDLYLCTLYVVQHVSVVNVTHVRNLPKPYFQRLEPVLRVLSVAWKTNVLLLG